MAQLPRRGLQSKRAAVIDADSHGSVKPWPLIRQAPVTPPGVPIMNSGKTRTEAFLERDFSRQQ
jgi:hypothetical protein